MSKVIIIDALTDRQICEVADLVKKFEEENENPKNVIDYENGYVITNGEIREAIEYYASQVNNLYSIGLYRDTKKECEKLLKKMQIEHRLRQWSKMCKDEVDWSNGGQNKYYIYKHVDSVLTEIYNQVRCNDIYFTDKSILQKAIADIGEQKLIDEYFVEV